MDVLIEECSLLSAKLEKQELDSPGGIVNGLNCSKLLALYLLQNDLCNAKYLWKRTPQSVKLATPEMTLVWNVGQKMWQRDFFGIHNALNQDWSENVVELMNALKEVTRNRAINLIAKAYSSIRLDEFSNYVGLNPQDTLQLVSQNGWNYHSESRMVLPLKTTTSYLATTTGTRSDEQLSKLTDFVSFLEN